MEGRRSALVVGLSVEGSIQKEDERTEKRPRGNGKSMDGKRLSPEFMGVVVAYRRGCN